MSAPAVPMTDTEEAFVKALNTVYRNQLTDNENRLTGLENNLKTMNANVSDRMAALAVGGNTVADSPADNLAVFKAITKSNIDAEGLGRYRNALKAYFRKGPDALTSDLRNDLSVGYEPGGGYLVTPDTTGAMISLLRETSPIRQVATQQTISTDALEGIIDNDEAETGWVSETAARGDTNTPDIGKYRIELFEQYAQPKATQQLLDDASINVEAWLNAKVADKISRTENTAFVRGNGSGKPRGFLDYPKAATADATRPWGTIQYMPSGKADGFLVPTTSVSPADALVDLVFSLKASYRAGAAFMMSSATAGIVRKWKDAQGRFVWQDSLQAGMPSLLMGYPVVFAEDMDPVAAGTYPIAFADWKRAYTIVDHRVGLRVLRDPYTQKGFVKFYSTKRTGGGITGSDSIKLLKIATS